MDGRIDSVGSKPYIHHSEHHAHGSNLTIFRLASGETRIQLHVWSREELKQFNDIVQSIFGDAAHVEQGKSIGYNTDVLSLDIAAIKQQGTKISVGVSADQTILVRLIKANQGSIEFKIKAVGKVTAESFAKNYFD